LHDANDSQLNGGFLLAVGFKPYISTERFLEARGSCNLQAVALSLFDGGEFIRNGILEG